MRQAADHVEFREERSATPGEVLPQAFAEAAPERSVSAQFVHGLVFEHLRSLTTLSVSATGGGLLAVQGGLLPASPIVAIPIVAFAFAAVLSFMTQRALVRDLGADGTPGKAVGIMSEISAGLFGAGVGAAVVILLLL